MVEPDGIGYADLDSRLKEPLDNDLNDVVIFSDDPCRIQECKAGIREYIDIFSPIGPNDFVKIDPIVFNLKSDDQVRGTPKFLKQQPLRNPKDQSSMDTFITKLGPLVNGRIEEVPYGESVYNTPVFIKQEAFGKARLLHNSRLVLFQMGKLLYLSI